MDLTNDRGRGGSFIRTLCHEITELMMMITIDNTNTCPQQASLDKCVYLEQFPFEFRWIQQFFAHIREITSVIFSKMSLLDHN